MLQTRVGRLREHCAFYFHRLDCAFYFHALAPLIPLSYGVLRELVNPQRESIILIPILRRAADCFCLEGAGSSISVRLREGEDKEKPGEREKARGERGGSWLPVEGVGKGRGRQERPML